MVGLKLLKLLTPLPDVDGLLGIVGPYFEGMIDQIYRTELQLNRANSSGAEAPFLTWPSP